MFFGDRFENVPKTFLKSKIEMDVVRQEKA
jgi:hypothetical protein